MAKTEEEIAITSTLEKIGVDLDSVELKMVGEMVVCIDKATGKEVCRDGSFDLHFAQEAIAASGKLATRTYEPKILNGGYVVAPTDKFFYEYTNKMLTKFILGHKEKYGVDFSIYKNLSGIEMMLDSVNKYWGMLLCRQEDPEHEFRYLIYEMTDENGGVPILPQMGEIVKVPILPTTPEEVMSYWKK